MVSEYDIIMNQVTVYSDDSEEIDEFLEKEKRCTTKSFQKMGLLDRLDLSLAMTEFRSITE
jgi:hypothetical protein